MMLPSITWSLLLLPPPDNHNLTQQPYHLVANNLSVDLNKTALNELAQNRRAHGISNNKLEFNVSWNKLRISAYRLKLQR